jgi:hypothetical protein
MNKTIGVLFYVDIVQVVDDPHLFTPGGYIYRVSESGHRANQNQKYSLMPLLRELVEQLPEVLMLVL